MMYSKERIAQIILALAVFIALALGLGWVLTHTASASYTKNHAKYRYEQIACDVTPTSPVVNQCREGERLQSDEAYPTCVPTVPEPSATPEPTTTLVPTPTELVITASPTAGASATPTPTVVLPLAAPNTGRALQLAW